ncbi:MAG: hypothetical protein Q7R79_03520 [bacterium]|nr:hypothetical protein [bacterium]
MKKLLRLLPVCAFLFLGNTSLGYAHSGVDDLEISLIQLRQARQEFKVAKNQEAIEIAEEAKAKAPAQKQTALRAREEAAEKKEGHRKEIVLKLMDIHIKWMNHMKENVQRMPNVTDDLKLQLTGEVNTTVQKLNELKTRISAARTRDDVIVLAKEVREFFTLKHETVKKIVDAIHASRASIAVAKAESRLNTIKMKLEDLKNQGKTIAGTETDLEDADKNIKEGKEALGRNAFREANEDLKGVYQAFRNIATKAKGL